MKNYVQKGESITFTAAADLSSGDIVVIGNLIGVVVNDVANGAEGVAQIEGVFGNIPKVTAAVFVKGEKLIWDVSAGKFDDSAAVAASGDVTGAVVAWIAGENGQTTCTIRLTPGNSTVTA